MYRILGYVNIMLLITVTSPYWLRRFNQRFFTEKKPAFASWIKRLRKIHKPLGVSLVLLSLLHGYLALGSLRLHTGSVAWVMILIVVILGGLFYKKKKAVFFTWHKRAALIMVLFVLLHLWVPDAFYYIFR